MHIIESTFGAWRNELSMVPQSALSKIQRIFYCAFPLLSFACVVLTVTTHRTDAVLIVIAILSALYEGVMCCCCMRIKIKLGYALWLHTGVLMILCGFIALEFAKVAAGAIFFWFGLVFILIVLICFCLGYDVLVERNVADYADMEPLEEQHWV